MKREKIVAEKRDITGKKVRKLRREGLLPANIYGKGFKSTEVQLPLKDFQEVFKIARETGLVDLSVGKDTYPVLIHNVQIHPLTHLPLHADFFKVNLKEKVKTTIPIVAIGEAKAVTEKIGALLQPLSEVEVEALPTDLPENIEVPIENLAAVGDNITVEDLKAPDGVVILAKSSESIFRIDELVSQEAEKLAEEEAAAVEAATESDEKAQEGEEKPKEEGSDQDKDKAQDESSSTTDQGKSKPTDSTDKKKGD